MTSENYAKSQEVAKAKEEAEAKVAAEKAAVKAAANAKEAEAAAKLAKLTAEAKAKDLTTMAAVICKGFVKAGLKAPSTADFPLLGFKAWKQPEQTYTIKSYVDAQNSYGAMLRSDWHCKVQYQSGDEASSQSWKLIELEII